MSVEDVNSTPLTPHRGHHRTTQCERGYMVRHPRGSSYYIVFPLLSLEVVTPKKKNLGVRRLNPYSRKQPQGAEARLTSGYF